jgi:hypothetical protein
MTEEDSENILSVVFRYPDEHRAVKKLEDALFWLKHSIRKRERERVRCNQ